MRVSTLNVQKLPGTAQLVAPSHLSLRKAEVILVRPMLLVDGGGRVMLKRLAGLGAMLAFVATAACTQTDADLAKDVQDRLTSDPIVKSYHLDVSSERKVVSIAGTVNTSAAKDQALQIARGTAGVVDVRDHVAVRDNEGTRGWLNRSSGAIGTRGTRP